MRTIMIKSYKLLLVITVLAIGVGGVDVGFTQLPGLGFVKLIVGGQDIETHIDKLMNKWSSTNEVSFPVAFPAPGALNGALDIDEVIFGTPDSVLVIVWETRSVIQAQLGTLFKDLYIYKKQGRSGKLYRKWRLSGNQRIRQPDHVGDIKDDLKGDVRLIDRRTGRGVRGQVEVDIRLR